VERLLGVAALLYLGESKLVADSREAVLEVLLLFHFVSIHFSPDEVRSTVLGAVLLECRNLSFDVFDMPLDSFPNQRFGILKALVGLVGLKRFGPLQGAIF
jgi:hypothetical protein